MLLQRAPLGGRKPSPVETSGAGGRPLPGEDEKKRPRGRDDVLHRIRRVLLGWVALGGGAPEPGAEPSLSLEVLKSRSAEESVWPRAAGLEIPMDFLQPGQRLALLDQGGVEIPARIESLVAWPSGRPHWIRLTAGELRRRQRRLRVTPTRRPRAEPTLTRVSGVPGLQLAAGRQRELLVVRAADVHWSREGAKACLEWSRLAVVVDGVTARKVSWQQLRWQGPDGAGCTFVLAANLSGPGEYLLPLSVQVEHRLSSQGRWLEIELAVTASATLVLRRLDVPGQLHGKQAEMHLAGHHHRPSGRKAVHALAGRGETLFGGATLGTVAPGLTLATRASGTSLCLDWPEFGRRRPQAAALFKDGRFVLSAAPEPVMLEPGQTLRRRFLLRLGSARRPAGERPYLVTARRSGWRWNEDTEGWLANWRSFLAGWLERQVFVEDRGCYPSRWGSFANGEYDLGASLLHWGREEGDPVLLSLGEAMVQHTLDWDRCGDPPVEWPRGLFWMHGDRHASGALEMGHVWTDGFAQLFRTTASSRAWAAARSVTGALSRSRAATALFEGPERRLSWPLRALVDQAAVHDSGGLREMAGFLLERIASRQDQRGHLKGDERWQAGSRWIWVNTWVTLGITVDALLRDYAWRGHEESRERAGRLVHFVLEHGRLERGGLAEVILVDPFTGKAIERRGRVRRGAAALAAGGLCRWQRVQGHQEQQRWIDELMGEARRSLATPREERLVDLAQALQGLRTLGTETSSAFRAPGRRRNHEGGTSRAGSGE